MRTRVATQTPPGALDAAAATLTATLEAVFTAIQPLVDAAEAQLAPGIGAVDAADLEVEPIAAAILHDADGIATGAGFVAAPGVLRDHPTWLEWWTVPTPGPDAVRERVAPEAAPDGTPTYDYTSMPWMVVPRETGERHVTGPYVDYFCTSEYALTFTVPVSAAGAFGGVVGVDVPVAELEQRVGEVLGALGAPAALVNATGRVLTTVDFGLLTGDLVRDVPFAELWSGTARDAPYELRRCGGLPFGVLVRTGEPA